MKPTDDFYQFPENGISTPFRPKLTTKIKTGHTTMKPVMKPHKHAELIKAWADGATIEMLCDDNEWYIPLGPINWAEYNTYRIKPYPEPVYRELVEGEIIQKGDEFCDGTHWSRFELFVGGRADLVLFKRTRTTRPAPAPKPEPKPDLVVFYRSENGRFEASSYRNMFNSNLRLTFDGTTKQRNMFNSNLRLTFDGTTKQLKSAEVIA